MIVVDASVVATALADDTSEGDGVRARLGVQVMHAPQLLDLEVASVLCRALAHGDLDEERAELALVDLGDLAVVRYPHTRLLSRIWQLRDNVSPYDAAYVALAEALDVALVTADGRLSRSPGIRCQVEHWSSPR